MPGLTGTLIDETFELDVLAGTTYAFDLPEATEFDLNILVPEPIVNPPRIVFHAVAAAAALVSTLDVLTWQAVAAPAALTSQARSLTWAAAPAPAAVVSTLDVLTWVAASAPAAVTSPARNVS
jgi:hypothetical protein